MTPTDWDFSNTDRDGDGPTANFIHSVGNLVAEHHGGLNEVWETACKVCSFVVSEAMLIRKGNMGRFAR